MRTWISMVMAAAFVMATMMPAASHASMHQHDAAASSSLADCHHHDGEKAGRDSHDGQATKQPSEKPCCDQGVCKCLNGACHGGLAAIPSNTETSLQHAASTKARFGFAEANRDLVLADRLQRPPRA